MTSKPFIHRLSLPGALIWGHILKNNKQGNALHVI